MTTDPARHAGAPTSSRPRILCVDDEAPLVQALARSLRGAFDVTVASNGRDALAVIERDGPFAVAVSDLKMPGMDGIQLLSAIRGLAPDTVRVLLTGHADVESAIAAVNQGNIFRILCKPVSQLEVAAALGAAADQHRLITAERQLLEETLRGCVGALTDTLALAEPASFRRATRVKGVVTELLRAVAVPDAWQVEVAAMLSHIAVVTLPPTVARKLNEGRPLSEAEREQVDKMPAMADWLLARIPRLDDVRAIIRYQRQRFDGGGVPGDGVAGGDIPVGARLLKIAVDLEDLEDASITRRQALQVLRGRDGVYDPDMLTALEKADGVATEATVVEIAVAALRAGMVIARDIHTSTGALLLARGYEVTETLLERLRNRGAGQFDAPVYVYDTGLVYG